MADDQLDTTPLRFGKYKGKTPEDVAEIDPSYIVWMHANVLPPPCSRALAIACERDMREEEDARAGFADDDFDSIAGNFGDWGDH